MYEELPKPNPQHATPALDAILNASSPRIQIQTAWAAISGGPSSGKTTLLRALGAKGFAIEFEAAEELIKEGIARGLTSEQVKADRIAFSTKVGEMDCAAMLKHDPQATVFFDTSLVEDIVYAEFYDSVWPAEATALLETMRFKKIFLLEPLSSYEENGIRTETAAQSALLRNLMLEKYRSFGYEPISVPNVSVEERVTFILSRL